jgi:signal transduction histidine kinase
MSLPLLPLYLVDISGSALTIVFALLALSLSSRLFGKETENIFWLYLVWLSFSLAVFSLSRGIGHILQYIFVFGGRRDVWEVLNPISGSLNTLSFVFTATVSLFFIEIQGIYQKISADKDRMVELNRELTGLNEEIEGVISERALNIMALRVADKVRNPATVIGAVAGRLMKSPETAEAVREKLRDILESSGELNAIVKEYETILESKEAFFRYEDLNEAVREILPHFERQAFEEKIVLEVHLSETPASFYAIKHLIPVAIAHLIRNAFEVSAPGGRIIVRTGREDRRVFLSVSDEGRGIPEEDRERIFDIFFSTKGRIGTGLPVVKQIVDEHGGEIRIESEAGKGSAFYLYFPAGWIEFGKQAKEAPATT